MSVNYKKDGELINIAGGRGSDEIYIGDEEPRGLVKPDIWINPSGKPKPLPPLEVAEFSNFYDLLEYYEIPLGVRRNTFRGWNLGSVVTDEQKEEIKNGTFRGLFVGDYWEINDIVWRIADIDYWIGCGDEECTTHHLVVMPDRCLYNQGMNSSNITTGGYIGSRMYISGLDDAKLIINSVFGEKNILRHREYLTSAVTSGYPSLGEWRYSTIELPNECMMYGYYVNTPSSTGSTAVARYTVSPTALALMKIHPKWTNPHEESQWLRDVCSNGTFAIVTWAGNPSSTAAGSNSVGVRPVFGLTGGE